jgi:hypothetical protein
LAEALPERNAWGVEIVINVDQSALDPGSPPAAGIDHVKESPIVGPFSPEERPRVVEVIPRLASVQWLAIQAEALAERAILDTAGRTVSSENERYWRSYIGVAHGPLAGALVSRDAVWRERYLQLARRWRHVAPERAAEYAKSAADMLGGDPVVISAPTYTVTSRLEQYNDELLAADSDGRPVERAVIAQAIGEEFADLQAYWPGLRVRQRAQLLTLSNQANEGIAVWREFAISVLLRQEVIRPLAGHGGVDTPADVLAPYENASPDSDYVVGFRAAAAVALAGTPWYLFSLHLTNAALFLPLELLEPRMPATELLRLPEESPLAPNTRLRRLADLPLTDQTVVKDWLEEAYATLSALSPDVGEVVDSMLTRHEGETDAAGH